MRQDHLIFAWLPDDSQSTFWSWKIQNPPLSYIKSCVLHVLWGYELHLWSSVSKIWPKVSKTCDISRFLQFCQILPLFETLSQILLREGHKWSSYTQCQDATFDAWQGGDSLILNFPLQMVDWGPSGRQNWRNTIKF